MPVAQFASGTQAATIGTEHALVSNSTTADAFQVHINVLAMAAGDVLEIAVKGKVLATDSELVIYRAVLAGVQGEPVWPSMPLMLMHGWSVTIKQTAGTGRSYSWSVRRMVPA